MGEMQQPIDSTHLQYFEGLLIVAIAGSLGGLVSAIGALVETGVDQNGQFPITKGVSVALFLFGRCVVGVGGAAAVLLAALTVDKFTRETDHLALTVLCFVAGSIGYRLLPMVAAQIEKRLGEVEKKAARAEKTAKDGVDSASVTSNVLSALQVLRDPEEMTSFVDDTVSHLEKVAREFPQDRSLHIVLARL
jgi:hypothetical protein